MVLVSLNSIYIMHYRLYEMHNFIVLAIAGKDFCVVAGDTRQSEGFSIQSRFETKVWRL